MTDSEQKTIAQLSEDLRARRLSPVELTRACLERIEALNPALNAFIMVTAELALEQAQVAEEEIMRGIWRGPLHGIPIGLKDLIDTAGIPTTAASEQYKHRIPTQTAEVALRLEQAGAVLLGKHNMHEFAYGGSSMISAFGEVHNFRNHAHIAGGSSGGSAAAVSAGLGYGAIGSDTAGSIREPAALCGVVGLKPTYARVSANGIIPLSQSLDHVGPIARNAADAYELFRVIAGPASPEEASLVDGGRRAKLRIGIPRSFFYEDLDPEVGSAVARALDIFAGMGDLREIHLDPDNDRTVQAFESFAFHQAMVAKTPDLYHPETLRRIKTGEKFTREQYHQKLAELGLARQKIGELFDTVDVIVTPTTPIPAPQIAELKSNPDLLRPRELVLLRNTRPFNVWGIPAISIPCGSTATGLPIGIQIAGAPGHDYVLLGIARACETANGWVLASSARTTANQMKVPESSLN